ncbi:D-alanyl-D-alanine carboxypeptidase/D-alanyl-D-alanine-endopeptidase [Amycolatopsis bartoniae]|nr:D-alanyl-D-alanine carboxypeptidase/D-alanyl-D-alanine-endopeptidase [Amycolatopsis bartoniae]
MSPPEDEPPRVKLPEQQTLWVPRLGGEQETAWLPTAKEAAKDEPEEEPGETEEPDEAEPESSDGEEKAAEESSDSSTTQPQPLPDKEPEKDEQDEAKDEPSSATTRPQPLPEQPRDTSADTQFIRLGDVAKEQPEPEKSADEPKDEAKDEQDKPEDEPSSATTQPQPLPDQSRDTSADTQFIRLGDVPKAQPERGGVEDTQLIPVESLKKEPPARPQEQRRPPAPPQRQPQPQQPPPWAKQGVPPMRPIPPAGMGQAQPMRIEPTGEMRPAEAVQPNEPTPPPPPAPPARRSRKPLLIGAIALVLVIAVGVALALPAVSNRLGLPWAPNVPKGDEPEPAAVTLALHGPSTSAPTPSSSGVAAALAGPAGAGALGTLAGIVIDPATGNTLWSRNPTQLLTPASATKLLTTSAALLKLDHGLQLSTKVVQGSSPDTAVIVAGGDPTLSSLPDGQESIYPGAAHLDDLVAQVKQASGGTIRKVQIDLSLYSGSLTGPGWAPEDAPSTYAVPIVPGMLDAGRSNPKVDEVSRTGNPAGALLQAFAQRLGATAAGNATAPQGAKVLGEVKSAPLTELVDRALQISDNVLAEAIGRQTALANGAAASFAGTAQSTLSVLAQNGFDTSGSTVDDGSGLSTLNRVSPQLLAQLLTVAAAPDDKDPRTAKLRPLLEGLPVAGGSGTLAGRFDAANASQGKGWVRAKTGTLSGVNTLAGLVLDADGRVLVFAFMSNGSDINVARPALDAVAAALRGCGCR